MKNVDGLFGRKSSTSPRKGLGRFLRGAENALNASDPFFQICNSEGMVIARSKVMRDSKDPHWPPVKMDWKVLAATSSQQQRQNRRQHDHDSFSDSEQTDSEDEGDVDEEMVLDQRLEIQVYDWENDSTHQLLGQFTTSLRECMQKAEIVNTTLKNTKINTLRKREDPVCCFDLINYEKATPESCGHLHVKTAKITTGSPDVVDDHFNQGGMRHSLTLRGKRSGEGPPVSPVSSPTSPQTHKEPEDRPPKVETSPRELKFDATPAAATAAVATASAASYSPSQPITKEDDEKEAWRLAKEMQRARLEQAKRTVKEAQAARLAAATGRAVGATAAAQQEHEEIQKRKAQQEQEALQQRKAQQEQEALEKRKKEQEEEKRKLQEEEKKRRAEQAEALKLAERAKQEAEAMRAAKLQEVRRRQAERQEAARKAKEEQEKQRLAAEEDAKKQQLREQEALDSVDTKGAADLYEKLTEIPVPKDEDIQAIFEEVDGNGDGSLSMKEVEKAIIRRQEQFNLAPTIVMRAFQKADSDGDNAISRDEFFQFVRCINYFQNLLSIFEEMDKDGNRRLSREEFIQAAHILDVDTTHANEVFYEMDENKGGYVVFDEFCLWMSDKRALEDVARLAKAGKTFDASQTTSRGLNFDAIAGAAVLVDHSQEEQEKIAAEKAEAEAKRIEEELIAAAAAESERLEAERLAAERAAADAEAKRAEEKRLAEEKAAAELEAKRVEEERLVVERVAAEAEAMRLEEEHLEAEEAKRLEVEAVAKRLADEAYMDAEVAERARQLDEEENAMRLAESDEEELRKWDDEAAAEEMEAQAVQAVDDNDDHDALDELDELDALLADDMDMDVVLNSAPAPAPAPTKKSIPSPRMTPRRPARRSAPAGTARTPSSAKAFSQPARRSVSPCAKSTSSSVRTPSSFKVPPASNMTPRELAAKEKAEQRLLNARRGISQSPPTPHERRSVSPPTLIEMPPRSEDADVFTRLYRNDIPSYMVKRVNPRYYDSSP